MVTSPSSTDWQRKSSKDWMTKSACREEGREGGRERKGAEKRKKRRRQHGVSFHTQNDYYIHVIRNFYQGLTFANLLVIGQQTYMNASLVPRPPPDFISQPWRKTGFFSMVAI